MTHATAEALSAYLDRELDDAAARRVEAHLESCDACRQRYAGLRTVVAGLRRIEAPPLPPALDQAVARRIALAGERRGLLDRIEDGLREVPRQSATFALFAVVMALAAILYLFSYAVDQSSRDGVRVIFSDPPAASATAAVEVAGRRLERRGDLWVETGVDPAAARTLTWDEAETAALLVRHPDLARLRELDAVVAVRVDGDAVVLRHPR